LKKLTDKELEKILDAAATAAENFIFSQISKKEVLDMEINLKFLQEDDLNVNVEVILLLDELSKATERLADEAARAAILEIDEIIKPFLTLE
jgi:Protein of unknown function (DUF3194)